MKFVEKPSASLRPPAFAETRWSLIVAARDEPTGPAHRRAMEELARLYWPPLYAYLRRNGHRPEAAEDLTQAFFTRLIERNDLRGVDAAKGKFRSFVLASLKHYVSNERDKERALKRGGGVRTFSLSAGEAESGYGMSLASAQTPDEAFNRRWALTLLEHVVGMLRAEYAGRGLAATFDALQGTLTGEVTTGYGPIAATLGTTEGALQTAAHRLRKRYREMLRAEIAQTVSGPLLVEDELRELMGCL